MNWVVEKEVQAMWWGSGGGHMSPKIGCGVAKVAPCPPGSSRGHNCVPLLLPLPFLTFATMTAGHFLQCQVLFNGPWSLFLPGAAPNPTVGTVHLGANSLPPHHLWPLTFHTHLLPSSHTEGGRQLVRGEGHWQSQGVVSQE